MNILRSVLLTLTMLVSAGLNAEVRVETFTVYDDWQLDFALPEGTYACPGGTLEMVPVIPGIPGLPLVPACIDGKGLHVRDGLIYSCATSDNPDLTGILLYTFNANWDQESEGNLFGDWYLVPSETCDSATVAELYPAFVPNMDFTPDRYWAGTYTGKRTFIGTSDLTGLAYFGDFKGVAHGYGEGIEGVQAKLIEEYITYTTFPVPNELLELVFGVELLPYEGLATMTLKTELGDE